MRWVLVTWLSVAVLAGFLAGADALPAAPATRMAATAPATQASPEMAAAPDAVTDFSFDTIAGEAETASSKLTKLNAQFVSDGITNTVDSALPTVLGEVNARLADNIPLLAQAPLLETLRTQDIDFQQYEHTLQQWTDELSHRHAQLKSIDAELGSVTKWNPLSDADPPTNDPLFNTGLLKEWSDKRDLAVRKKAQPEVIGRINSFLRQATDLKDRVVWERRRLHDLQNRLTGPKVGVDEALAAVQVAQSKAVDRLLVEDSPPLWTALRHPTAQGNLAEQGRNSFSAQWNGLQSYVSGHRDTILLHCGGIAALAAGLIWLRRQTKPWAASDPSLSAATRVFQTPIATAIVVTLILMPWLYPAAPRLFWGIIGTAALLPTFLVIRPLIERSLVPLLYALIGASFLNLVRSTVEALPLMTRGVFLLQMGGAAIFFLWFLRTRRRNNSADPSRPPLRRTTVLGVRFGLVVTLMACVANAFGFVALSRLVGGALLTAAYLGVLLDTSVHVLDALLLGASHLRPLSGLGMVQRHRPALLKRLHQILVLLAIGLWGYFTLDALSARAAVVTHAKQVWAWPKDVDEVFAPVAAKPAVTVLPAAQQGGAAQTVVAPVSTSDENTATLTNQLYIGGVVLFVVTLAAAFYLARFIAFLLDEDVYPRLHLARGMPYAISTLLRYVILAVGFTLAIAKLGYNDMTKLTILVSAFGVGLGFGMQNIVNNFVSGLILLFERPVQVGDVIELDNFTGVVSRIGIRASIIRTPLAAEIIVPNGRLISDRVINWTLSNRQRGVEIPLTVDPLADPQRLIQLLMATAKSHPLVAAYPTPQAFFTEFSGGGMKFEVRAWTNRFEDWAQVRSELSVAINAMLLKENIALK